MQHSPRLAAGAFVTLALILTLGPALVVFDSARLSAQAAPPPPAAKKATRPAQRDSLSDSARAELRRVAREAREIARLRLKSDTLKRRALANAALPTAFADSEAEPLLARARLAREQQDSALRSYSAIATQRISVGMGVRHVGLEKLLFRGDNVARIAWKRGVGVWVTPVGSRMVVPMASHVDGNFSDAISIPYFPGKESLWLPSSDFAVVKSDINERDMVHPFARGAEAYYKYATGDSITITLPGGKKIRLRELRVTARKPDWRLFVGSFWFDVASGQLVRAAYRLSVNIDIWDLASESIALDKIDNVTIEHLRDSLARATLDRTVYVQDSTRRAVARRNGNNDEDDAPAWVKAMFRPATAKLDAITIEYGLYEGRFWLPRANSATASAQMGFMRVPLSIDEKYSYESVDGDLTLPALPQSLTAQLAQRDSLARATGRDSASRAAARDSADAFGRLVDEPGSVNVSVSSCIGTDCKRRNRISQDSADRATVARLATRRDSLLKVAKSSADSARARARYSSRREVQCLTDTTWVRTETRYEGALRVGYRMPCNLEKLQTAKELPASYTSDEELFDMKSKDELLAALDLSLQPAWSPQMPKVRTGIDLIHYDRVEGLSVGVLATASLGAGYTASATARLGHADLHPNAELTLERSNGRRTAYGTVFHRLAAVNPEWGGAMTFGASMSALLYARDEGFYYRTFGVEVGERMSQRHGALDWRLFTEHQYTAGDSNVRNTFSFGRWFGDRRFRRNIESELVSLTGVGANWQRAFGSNPLGWHATTEVRGEAATGTFQYGRGAFTSTVSRPLGPIAFALTGGVGNSFGRVPVQRTWYLGGLRSVRGQVAGTQQGDAYWLLRSEIGGRAGGVRPVVFYDAGWAGSRRAFAGAPPQKGAGFGLGLLDGLIRLDVARGLGPTRKWRTDLYLEAPL